MSLKYLNYLIPACLVLGCMGWIASADVKQPGFLEGHLKVTLSREVDLADGTPTPLAAETYAELPPGNYVLDIQRRPRGRVRATPQPFTVVSNQTVHVNMEIDPGIR